MSIWTKVLCLPLPVPESGSGSCSTVVAVDLAQIGMYVWMHMVFYGPW